MQNPKWIPIEPNRLSPAVDVTKTGNQYFNLGTNIPTSAKEVLVYVSLQVGHTEPHDKWGDIKIFTADDCNEYAQYMTIRTYRQNAWVTNSDNMWFPVTDRRQVVVNLPHCFVDNHIHLRLYVIGHR